MIYKMDVWRKSDAQGSATQELYCLSDMHGVETLRPQDAFAMNVKDQEQRAQLVAACKQFKRDGASDMVWIIEDAFALSPHSHKGIADYLKLYKPAAFAQPAGQQPILLHFLYDILTDVTHSGHHGVAVYDGVNNVVNVESRQQRIISHLFYTVLGELKRTGSPLLKQFHKNINTLYGPALQEVAQEFDQDLARVRAYAAHEHALSNKHVAEYYKAVIKRAEQSEPFSALLRGYSYRYWDLAGATSPAVLSTLVNAFLLWGMEMVDAHAVHALLEAQDRKKVCMILGGVHIAAISKLLPFLGYTKVETIGADSLTVQEHDKRAQLLSELYNVEQLVPIPESPSFIQQVWRSLTGSSKKNILVADLTVDAHKLQEFNALNLKFAQVEPVDTRCFETLSIRSDQPSRQATLG